MKKTDSVKQVLMKSILSCLFLLLAGLLPAQTFVPGSEGLSINSSGSLYIPPATTLHIDGNLQNIKSKKPEYFRSNGVVNLTGNLVCYSPIICQRADSLKPTCQFFFTPKTPTVTVTGLGLDSILLYQVIVNKPGAIVRIPSGTKLKILDTLDLRAGSILLDGGNVHFVFPQGTPSYRNHPYLKNENHLNRIFGDSGQVVMTVNATSSYSTTSLSSYSFANLGITLSGQHVQSAALTLRRGHAKQLYAGNGSITRYFDILTNQGFLNDTVQIKYIDSAEYIGLGINRHKLKVFASPGGDMDYVQLGGFNNLPLKKAEGYTTDLSISGISPNYFRITVADQDCVNPPVSALTADTIYLCQGATQLLDAGNVSNVPNNSTLAWNWSTGATTQTIAVSSPTVTTRYDVIIRDVRGCLTHDSVYVSPAAIPVADFYNGSACFGDSLKIKDMSTIATGSISTYQWNFGNATTYSTTVSDTIHKLYASPGAYSVVLTVTSNHGCTASVTRVVNAIHVPAASFVSTFNCLSNQMDFASTSTIAPAGGSITQNFWNFDMASTTSLTPISPATNPSYSYAPGTYTVKLLVRSGYMCKDSVTQSITVNQRNLAAFTVSNGCTGDTISFLNGSACNTGACSYVWDFGDGTQSFALNPKKIYTTATVYNVKLNIFNAGSCTDSSIVPIVVYPSPAVSFSTAAVCEGNTSYFTNQTTVATGSIVSYLWDFGNTTTAVSANASLTYTLPNTYQVDLKAASDMGCVAHQTQAYAVYPKPTAQYNAGNTCLGQVTTFNENSIGTSLSYLWEFGNTVTSSASNPSYTYPTAGVYSTSLIVTDPNGCADTSSLSLTVNAIPVPGLGGSITTCGTSYTLNAGPGTSYLWQPSNATTQTIVVTSNGTYSVTVTDANGCQGYDQVLVGLNAPVKPHLGNDTTHCGSYVLNAGYPGSIYLWQPGGATTQTLLATNSDTYIVTVTDLNNCTGKDTVVVNINTPPTLSLGPNISQCQGTAALTLTPVTSATTYSWSTGSIQPTIQANASGNYILTVTAPNGCRTSDTINVNLMPAPMVNLGPDATVCGSRLLDAQNTGFSYQWSTGPTAQTITALSSGQYWVEVTNPGNGCVSRDTINLVISTPVSVFLGNDTVACSGASFVLNAGNVGSSYSWSTGASTQTIAVGSSGGYGVTVTNGACSAFDQVIISVLPTPTVNLGSSIQYICGSGSIQLNAGSSTGVQWGGTNGFSSTQQLVNVSQSGKYWATVSNGACAASDTVEVIQSNQTLAAYFVASTIDTVGRPVKFVDVTQPTPTSWYWDFGDGFNSTLQSPEHTFLVPLTYSVTLTVSNGFCSSQITKSLIVHKIKPGTPTTNAVTLDLLGFNVYPNPASDFFRTTFEVNDPAHIDFYVYDMSGRLIHRSSKDQTAFLDVETNITDLRSGLYMIEVIAESPKGFVKQKGKLVIFK